jgi:hypothetical protein
MSSLHFLPVRPPRRWGPSSNQVKSEPLAGRERTILPALNFFLDLDLLFLFFEKGKKTQKRKGKTESTNSKA